jgi:hypothetical protein
MKKQFVKRNKMLEPRNSWIEITRRGLATRKRKCVQQYLDTKNSLGARGVPM